MDFNGGLFTPSHQRLAFANNRTMSSTSTSSAGSKRKMSPERGIGEEMDGICGDGQRVYADIKVGSHVIGMGWGHC